MADIPAGNVAFLFTDLEGSTRYWETHPDVMPAVYDRHDTILRQAVADHSGIIYKVIGDAIQAAFPSPEAGIAAAVQAQQMLVAEEWPLSPPPRVRMALHAAQISPDASGDFRSPLLNRLGRLLSAADGSQILLSEDLVSEMIPPHETSFSLIDLGEYRFRDLAPQRVFQVLAPGIPADRARLQVLSSHRDNLTPPANPLIGRDRELAEVSENLRQNTTRLMTLLGPGGVGKTRLAQAIGAELLNEFADGVWFVSLETLTKPADFPRAIALALDIREHPEESMLDTVCEHFSRRHALLLLDNFEQIVEASPDVAALLRACPRLSILATSRVPLDLTAEIEFPVSPLPVEASAVDLFLERLRAVQPAFQLTSASRETIVQICRRLDGLPLAIELAAARGRLLPVDKLLARLEQRLPLLTGGPRDAPDRQRALESTIAWSVDLLSPSERACFAGMSIFAGGATIDALEPVLGAFQHARSSRDDVLSLAEGLLRHSLVMTDSTGRLTMLETIREYAAALLRDSGNLGPLQESHARYFHDLVLKTEPRLILAEQAEASQMLFSEWANIRQALSHLESMGPASIFVHMASSLWRFWSVRGMFSEGRRWLDSAIDQAQTHGLEGPLLASALEGAGILAESQGDADKAQSLHLNALAIWRDKADTTGIARSLENLGIIALHVRGDLALAREYHAEALQHFEQTKDQRGIASSLKSLADVALFREDFADASALYAKSLSIARKLHDSRGIAAGLTSLGALAFLEGDPERATTLYEEAVAFWRLLDDVPGIALCVGNLGEALDFAGRSDEAVPLLMECLDLSREIGDQQGIAFALTHLGRLGRPLDIRQAAQNYAEAAELSRSIGDNARLAESVEGLAGSLLDAGHAEMAARLFGLAQAIREQTGVALPTVHEPALAGDLANAKLALGSVKFSALLAEGFASDLDALLPSGGLTAIGDRFS